MMLFSKGFIMFWSLFQSPVVKHSFDFLGLASAFGLSLVGFAWVFCGCSGLKGFWQWIGNKDKKQEEAVANSYKNVLLGILATLPILFNLLANFFLSMDKMYGLLIMIGVFYGITGYIVLDLRRSLKKA
jgi:membrane protease YdiL (CAAX protease family)